MPIFEFRCLECSNLFEKIFLSSDEKADIQCPECHSVSFERVVSKTSYVMGMECLLSCMSFLQFRKLMHVNRHSGPHKAINFNITLIPS